MANKDEQLLKILDNSACLRKRQMLSYIKKELFPEELRAVELHLVGCKLCHDAIEGLKKLEDIEEEINELPLPVFPKIEIPTKSIENKIHTPNRRIKKRKKGFQISGSVSIVALITLGIVSIYFFEYRPNVQKQKQVSSNNKPTVDRHVTSTLIDTSSLEDNQNNKIIENNQVASLASTPVNNVDQDEVEKPEQENFEEIDTQKKAINQEVISKVNTPPVMVNKKEQSNIKEKIEEKKEIIKKEEQPKPVPESVSVKKTVETDFDIGLSLFNKGNYASALLYFKNAESNKDNPRHIDAIYYSALCNKHLNKKGRARRMLKQVIKADGKFKIEAENELNNL